MCIHDNKPWTYIHEKQSASSILIEAKDIHRDPVCMGWLRLVGSLRLYVSFAEYSLVSRARVN